jgi:hypothetical protein
MHRQITEIGNIIGEVFDFTELSKRTLGREWKKMKGSDFLPGQQQERPVEGLRPRHRRRQPGEKLSYPVQRDYCQRLAREAAGNFTG